MCCNCAMRRSISLDTHGQDSVLVQQQAARVVTCAFRLSNWTHCITPPHLSTRYQPKSYINESLCFLWQSTCSVSFQLCMSTCTSEYHQQPSGVPKQRNATARTPCDCNQLIALNVAASKASKDNPSKFHMLLMNLAAIKL